jgi:hypothetical protein
MTIRTLNNTEQKENAGGIRKYNLKAYYRGITTKATRCWNENRSIDQWNKMLNPGISSHIFNQMILYTQVKNMFWRNTAYSTNSDGKTEYPYVEN